MQMPGKGKYTTFNTPASARKSFLERLFKGDGTVSPPFYGMDQTAALAEANKRGNDILRAGNFAGSTTAGNDVAHVAKDGVIDTGDSAFGKVDLAYAGRSDAAASPGQVSPPNTLEGKDVVWSPGGPANSYVPDISSPGPGKTEGTDKTTNPDVKTTDIKSNFDPAKASVNTASPTSTSGKVHQANSIGDGTIGLGKAPGKGQFDA